MSAHHDQRVPTLAALLPLKVGGRHYGDNLARLDLCFSSLRHFGEPDLLDELIVVVRDDEADLIARHLARWADLPLRMVVEGDHFEAFRRYSRPWQVRPWQRQQIIKLNAPAFTEADFVLTLDPDVMAVKPVTRELLLPGGRALLEPEAREVHRQWWLDSADLLDADPRLAAPGVNVTPALLSTGILRELHRQLETAGGRAWMDVLLTSYCEWTEYTLYLIAAEQAGLVAGHHVWADAPEAPAHLHTRPELSIWDPSQATEDNVERLFHPDDPGLFAVVQSSTGMPASTVAAVAGRHFRVRSVEAQPVPPTASTSKLRERGRVVARLIAQRVYRLRRTLRSGRPRGTRPLVGAPDPTHSEP